MNRAVTIALITTSALLLAPWSASVFAQNQKGIPRTGFDCTGTVKDVGAGVFQLAADDGEQWLVKVEAQPKDISYSGSADVSFLRPGMFVRFSSKLNRRGQTADKIGELTVITPKADTPLGLNAEEGSKTDRDLFTDPKGEKRSKPKPKPGVDPTYEIAGRVTKVSRAELTIDAAGTPVRAQLDDKVNVSLDLADLTYLRAGDKIEMSGWYLGDQKGRAWATKVTATAAEPLSDAAAAAKKGKAAPPSREKTVAPTKKDAP